MRFRYFLTVLMLPLALAGTTFAQGVSPESAQKYTEGQDLYKKRKYREALAVFEEAVKLDGKNAQAYRAQGMTLEKLRTLDKAEEAYKMATTVKPDYVEAYFQLGYLQLSRKKYEEGQTSFKKVIQINPGFQEGKAQEYLKLAYLKQGTAYYRQRNYPKAAAEYEAATQIDPSDATAFYNLGLMQKLARKYSAAEQAFETAVDLDPDYGKAHRALGDLYEDTGKNSSAVSAYLKAIKADDTDNTSRRKLASVYQKINQNDQAIAVLKKGAEVDPKDEEVLVALGKAYSDAKQYQNAIANYKKALAIKESAEGNYRISVAYFETKQYQSAIAASNKALSSRDWAVRAHVILGDCYRELGEKDKAVEHYKKGTTDRIYKKYCEDQIDRILNPMGGGEEAGEE